MRALFAIAILTLSVTLAHAQAGAAVNSDVGVEQVGHSGQAARSED